MSAARIDVVHIGSASRDLTPDDPRGWRLGGGVAYAALTTARLGLRTAALIGVDATSATADELDLLRDAGVEVVLARLAEAPVFDNLETPAGRVQVCHTVGRPLGMGTLPTAWGATRAWSLVPVAGEVGEAWTAVLADGAFVAVGWQGLLRVLKAGRQVARRAPAPSSLVRRADLVGVSHHDLAPGTSLASLAALLRPGADLVITEGSLGGRLVHVGQGDDEIVRFRPTPTELELDATGAGDTFLAALLASMVRPAATGRRRSRSRARPDLGFAAAAASLTIEGPGLSAVPDRAAVLARREHDPGPMPVPGDASRIGTAGPEAD
jgi:sugar/nucleoside kinase (ribokinase family)